MRPHLQNNKKIYSQNGQILIILLLVIVVILAIGLSVVGRSNTEVSTASQIESSARAFSAAEGGIERLIANQGQNGISVGLLNNSTANVSLTQIPNASIPNIEQPSIGNNLGSYSFAQFWFANPFNIPDGTGYDHQAAGSNNAQPFYLWFGNLQAPSSWDNYPALEVHIIYWDGSKDQDVKYYYDSAYNGGSLRTSNQLGINNYSGCISPPPSPNSLTSAFTANTDVDPAQQFLCQVVVPPVGSPFPWAANPSAYPILARVRIIYSDKGQNVAIGPDNNPLNGCTAHNGNGPNNGCAFPTQLNIFDSNGISGQTERKIRVKQVIKVMPYIFDFALYAQASALSK